MHVHMYSKARMRMAQLDPEEEEPCPWMGVGRASFNDSMPGFRKMVAGRGSRRAGTALIIGADVCTGVGWASFSGIMHARV